jgi:hypothetical protein
VRKASTRRALRTQDAHSIFERPKCLTRRLKATAAESGEGARAQNPLKIALSTGVSDRPDATIRRSAGAASALRTSLPPSEANGLDDIVYIA